MPYYVVIAAFALAAALPLAWWSLAGARTGNAAAKNLQLGLADTRLSQLAAPVSTRAVRPLVESVARHAQRLTPGGSVAALEHRLQLAGQPAAWPLERVLGAKLLLGVGAVLLTGMRLLADVTVGGILLTAFVGTAMFFLPDVIISSRATERQKQIQLALPDTLDQLTISVEAGLGFDAALLQAGQRNEGPLAYELRRAMQDVQLGASTAAALRDLGDRSDVPELRHFVSAIVQASSHGIAIAQVLRVQAAELRLKRSQRAEEQAMKVPVKVIFPLILCILPALFVVIIGPAVIRVAESGFGG